MKHKRFRFLRLVTLTVVLISTCISLGGCNRIEELFVEGDYVQAQEKLNYILNNYHPAAFDLFKG